MTIRAAEFLRVERYVGSLEVGKFADLIVLKNNLIDASEDMLGQNEVLLTMVGGKIVYSAKENYL